jgi:hypothetical protein
LPSLFRKKPWEKIQCTFDLQEYGLVGGKGWASVSNAGEVVSVVEAAESFKPGKHYRLLARSLEDGKLVGVVWTHYEPEPGGLKEIEREEKKEKTKASSDPAEIMDRYVDSVGRTLEPIGKFYKAMNELRDSIFGTQPQVVQVAPEGDSVPTLDFEGKAPWYLHPYVVRTLGDEVTRVVDHLFSRLESVGLSPGKKGEGKEEEEDVKLPGLPMVIQPEKEEATEEAPKEEEQEEEPETLFPEIAPPREEEPPEVTAEVSPIVCLECGEEKPLGGNGLCADCNKKIMEAAESG